MTDGVSKRPKSCQGLNLRVSHQRHRFLPCDGRNLSLNIADHGFAVAGYDKDKSRVEQLQTEAAQKIVQGAKSLEEFFALLCTPRAVMILVPAGKNIDNVIRDPLPHLQRDDLIIDDGNSYFKDTNALPSSG